MATSRSRRTSGATEGSTPADDPEVFDGPADEDPALADPDASGATPAPDVDYEDVELDDEDVDLTKRYAHDDPDDEYVVLTDLIVVKTGPKPSNTARLARGQIVKFSEATRAFTNVSEFVRNKAIALNDGEPKRRTDARTMAAASGADDDPVAKPISQLVKEQPTIEPQGNAETA